MRHQHFSIHTEYVVIIWGDEQQNRVSLSMRNDSIGSHKQIFQSYEPIVHEMLVFIA